MNAVIVTTGPVAHGGHCVARHEGRVVFVRHALPRERVRIAWTEKQTQASFWRADAIEVLEPSPHRREHLWAEADALKSYAAHGLPVGGAEFGHIQMEEQHRLKAAVVREQFERLAGLKGDIEVAAVPHAADHPMVGMHWRTRVGFAISDGGQLGMHVHRSRTVLPIRDMPLADPRIRSLRLWERSWEGISQVQAVAPAGTPLICVTGERERAEEVADDYAGRARVLWRREGQRAFWHVEETVAGRNFRVSSAAFWQIHVAAPTVLRYTVSELLQGRLDRGDTVVDLYAGVGLFTDLLYRLIGESGTVLSVESSGAASRDAKYTFRDEQNIAVHTDRVERFLHRDALELRAKRHSARWGAVVLDPPRAGAGRTVVHGIVKRAPRSVVYVSCDPASCARDLGYFRSAGWTVQRVEVLDLYPNTHHMELVALLTPEPAGHHGETLLRQ